MTVREEEEEKQGSWKNWNSRVRQYGGGGSNLKKTIKKRQ